MGKKKILLLIIVLLFIPIVWLSIKYLSLSQKYNFQQNNIDNEFKSTLGRAMSGFGADFDKLPIENSRQFYYNEAMTNLYSASQLAEFTTYNKDIGLSLYNLYKLMEQNEYKQSVIKKSKLIYSDLFKLLQNPEDKGPKEDIIKLIEEIRNEE